MKISARHILFPLTLAAVAFAISSHFRGNSKPLANTNALYNWTPDAPEQWPSARWTRSSAATVGMSESSLDRLASLVGGNGFVSRHGLEIYTWGVVKKQHYIASAMKPVISTLLLCAIQEGKLKGVDAPLADALPALEQLNAGKDAGITWRHLACMTSGYGLLEKPGAAWAYNDFGIALYYDTLMAKVFHEEGTEVLRSRLASPMEFEDKYSFASTGVQGKLGLSARDLARYGLCILRNGRWKDKQLISPGLIQEMLHSPIPANLPITSGTHAAMLPDQRSIGGDRNDCPHGPGYYSFNWWLNIPSAGGTRPLEAVPPDTLLASGLWGKHALWVIPSIDLVVVWNSSVINDQRDSISNPATKMNAAAGLIRDCVVAK